MGEVGGEKNYFDPLYPLPRQRVNCNNAYRSVIDLHAGCDWSFALIEPLTHAS